MTYDPTIGKWLSEDPIGFSAHDMNLTRYVGNSSTLAIDPTGTQIIIDVMLHAREEERRRRDYLTDIANDPLTINLRITVLCSSHLSDEHIQAQVAEASTIWSQPTANIRLRVLEINRKGEKESLDYLYDPETRRGRPSTYELDGNYWDGNSMRHPPAEKLFLNDSINVTYVGRIYGRGAIREAGAGGFFVMDDKSNGHILAHAIGHNLLNTNDHTLWPGNLMNSGDHWLPGTNITLEQGQTSRIRIISHRYANIDPNKPWVTPAAPVRLPIQVSP